MGIGSTIYLFIYFAVARGNGKVLHS